MHVWLRWYEWNDFFQDWFKRDESVKTPFCPHCPCEIDNELPDFRWTYGSNHCVHTKQICTCSEDVLRSTSYYVPLQFIELSPYINPETVLASDTNIE